MKNKTLKKALAAVLSLTIIGGVTTSVGGHNVFLSPIIEAHAETQFEFDEETGTLIIQSGDDIKYADLSEYRYDGRVKHIIAKSGAKFNYNAKSMFEVKVSDESNYRSWRNIETIDLSEADTSGIIYGNRMFYKSRATSIKLGRFEKLSDMTDMFYYCGYITSLDLGEVKTDRCFTMNRPFYGCNNLRYINLSSFDLSMISRDQISQMFEGCQNLTSIDLTSFDTSEITNKNISLFKDCTNLKNIYVSDKWDINVTDKTLTVVDDFAQTDIIKVKGSSLSLDGNIGVNFYVMLPDTVNKAVFSGPNGEVTLNRNTINGLKQYEGDKFGTYKLTYEVNSTQANKKVKLKFYDENDELIDIYNSNDIIDDDKTVEFAVNDYELTPELAENEKLNDLVDSLKNYCAASEQYFNNGTVPVASNFVELSDTYAQNSSSQISNKYKISLVLDSQVSFRVYGADNADKAQTYLDNYTTPSSYIMQFVGKNTSKYGDYFEFSNIPADKLLNNIQINFLTYDEGNYEKTLHTIDTTFANPVYNYAKRVLDNGNSTKNISELVKALYLYAEAAKNYK